MGQVTGTELDEQLRPTDLRVFRRQRLYDFFGMPNHYMLTAQEILQVLPAGSNPQQHVRRRGARGLFVALTPSR